jgi:hypothetical protein
MTEPAPMSRVRLFVRGAFIGSVMSFSSACGDNGPSGVITYSVLYHVAATPNITWDSVTYENAQAVLVTVVAPAPDWGVTFSMKAGGYMQARAWGGASSGGQSATLTATWVQPGVSIASDTSTAVVSAPGKFTLAIARHQIP